MQLPWALGEPLEFLRLLWAVTHALHSTSKRLEATVGVTGPQRLALQMIGRFPQITAGQLARLLHVDPSTLTGIVQRLVRRGLIQRKPDAQDGRRTLLGLTAQGRRFELATRNPVHGGRSARAAGLEATESAVARTLSRLPPADVAAARKTLTALTETLGNGNVKASAKAAAASSRTGRGSTASKPTGPRRVTTPPRSSRRLPRSHANGALSVGAVHN
jgi:DNA-binding MarR family transcriptional regulator